jgi:hypothetical protein
VTISSPVSPDPTADNPVLTDDTDERLAVELEAALEALEAGPLEAVVALTATSARLVA